MIQDSTEGFFCRSRKLRRPGMTESRKKLSSRAKRTYRKATLYADVFSLVFCVCVCVLYSFDIFFVFTQTAFPSDLLLAHVLFFFLFPTLVSWINLSLPIQEYRRAYSTFMENVVYVPLFLKLQSFQAVLSSDSSLQTAIMYTASKCNIYATDSGK